MPSYAEDLAADRPRLLRAWDSLLEEQERVLDRLREELTQARDRTDRSVLKLLLLTDLFGGGSAEATTAQREAEAANTVMIELSRRAERAEQVLAALRLRQADAVARGSGPAAGP